MSDGVTVAVTDHAAERFGQRVGSRRGGFALVDPGRRWRERRDS